MYLIRPKSPDLVIPMPSGGDLPAAGAIVTTLDLYWVRRHRDGDVTVDEVAADTVDKALAELAKKGDTSKAKD